MSAEQIAAARKRRGVSRGSITRLTKKVTELEKRGPDPKTLITARQLTKDVQSTSTDFKEKHLSVVVLLENDADLEAEQVVLDEHDEIVADLLARLDVILTRLSSPEDDPRETSKKRLARLEKKLSSVVIEVGKFDSKSVDRCLIRQREEQLHEMKQELSDIGKSSFVVNLDEKDELSVIQTKIDSTLFDTSLNIKRFLAKLSSDAAAADTPGVKLPKIDVPTFSGDLLMWKSYWEQFSVAVDTRTGMSDAEKLVYLRHSVKDGSARHVIEGLTRSGDNYAEAVECLKSRYDRPRLIHQTHVRKIVDIPALKHGSGKELRHLHDTTQQHVRALKSMGYEPSGAFLTSILEIKLDPGTMFEWQKHSSTSTTVPHYNDLLEFLNLRAQASEHTIDDSHRRTPNEMRKVHKPIASHNANVTPASNASCPLCKSENHLLFACSKFKGLSHERKMATVKSNGLCLNCLRSGHFSKNCKSLHKCRECQRPHHTLLHSDSTDNPSTTNPTPVTSNTAAGLKSTSLLMTCQLLVFSHDGTSIKARALLDPGSSASFISDRLSKSLCLRRHPTLTRISGIAGLSPAGSMHPLVNFSVSSSSRPEKKFSISAIVIPRVTRNLPISSVHFHSSWKHLDGLQLADPTFGNPSAVDLLLGVDVFTNTLLNGRRSGPPGSPTALQTEFGWVLAGDTDTPSTINVTSHHVSLLTGDELLRQFWEIEEVPTSNPVLTAEESTVVDHFTKHHTRSPEGRFVVPLPKRLNVPDLGESRTLAVKRFLNLERSLLAKNQFDRFAEVMEEYFNLCHAEPVPVSDLHKSTQQVFYMPMHAVHKESSTTTKLRVVFDASAKTASGSSLNDILMVGPTVHSPLIDVLMRFRLHQIALTGDVSKMYRAIELAKSDRDYHRFVWRRNKTEPLKDYRMKRVTFGVSASSFIANMSVLQNSLDHLSKYPLAAAVVEKAFYVDDCLTGAETPEEAIRLRIELQELFSEAQFILRKWNSSSPVVLQSIPSDLRETPHSQTMPDNLTLPKTLGIEWDPCQDTFHLTTDDAIVPESATKREIASDIAKTYDVLGWFSPSIIKSKIFLQKLWERRIDWDDAVPPDLLELWRRWKTELPLLSKVEIPRCYFPTSIDDCSVQLHGFSDASEDAYSAVVYVRSESSRGLIHTSLVTSKTRVAPIKRQTIPRLELCGALLLSQLITHVNSVLSLPSCELFAWTDSMVVLGWIQGDPRRFKPFVANRVTRLLENTTPQSWRHVSGSDNPADCASRGLFPSELVQHKLWWNGPVWLDKSPSEWPQTPTSCHPVTCESHNEFCLTVSIDLKLPLIPLDRFSTYSQFQRVMAWVMRFVGKCRPSSTNSKSSTDHTQSLPPYLTTSELFSAELYWIRHSQEHSFPEEVASLNLKKSLPERSPILVLHPFMDSSGIIRVGGRKVNAPIMYSQKHPIILDGKHRITRLIIRNEHIRLLHAGPTLVFSSLSHRYHIISMRRIIRTVTRQCVTCRKQMARPQPQLLGQLPMERVTPGLVFERVGVDYAGPVYTKSGSTRRPVISKSYICVFVSLSVKAVHLELVSNLTTEAFMATLRRFVSRRGHPTVIMSDHGRNFIGAKNDLKDLFHFLEEARAKGTISKFCSTLKIEWSFIPERSPHFGGIWEAAVKSTKTLLRRVIGETKLSFEEMTTVLTQVEACLNSRPLMPLNSPDDDGIAVLTPGHFLVGQPLSILPDQFATSAKHSTLRRWHLCQLMIHSFWRRWSTEYINLLNKYNKWRSKTRNLSIGDIVVLKEENTIPTKWPLGRIVAVYPGTDGLVRVVDVRTSQGIYRRPITKLALLLGPENSD